MWRHLGGLPMFRTNMLSVSSGDHYTLKQEAAFSSEKFIPLYQATRRHILEGVSLQFSFFTFGCRSLAKAAENVKGRHVLLGNRESQFHCVLLHSCFQYTELTLCEARRWVKTGGSAELVCSASPSQVCSTWHNFKPS
jgi:hypothetical protein